MKLHRLDARTPNGDWITLSFHGFDWEAARARGACGFEKADTRVEVDEIGIGRDALVAWLNKCFSFTQASTQAWAEARIAQLEAEVADWKDGFEKVMRRIAAMRRPIARVSLTCGAGLPNWKGWWWRQATRCSSSRTRY